MRKLDRMELSLCIGRIQLTYLFYGPLFSYPFENYIYQGIKVLLHTPFKEKCLLFEVILIPDVSGIKSGRIVPSATLVRVSLTPKWK